MSALLTDQGANFVATSIFKGAINYEIGLFTNSSISAATTHADLTEPTGGGYARIALSASNWVVTNNIASYPKQTFAASGSNIIGTIYGMFVCTNTAPKKIIAIELRPEGAVTLPVGYFYDVTLNVPVVSVP